MYGALNAGMPYIHPFGNALRKIGTDNRTADVEMMSDDELKKKLSCIAPLCELQAKLYNKEMVKHEFLFDENYFYAPYGPTTAERNATGFMKKYHHECLWNGPSRPFVTSQTLTAMGNLLCNYNQLVVTKTDYYNLLHLYAKCQYLTENGKTIPFIDENLDPFTGEWLARKNLKSGFYPFMPKERGKDYNHSTFCDLVLSGLAGVRPDDGNTLTVNPLFTDNDLEYFCADGILYHGEYITVIWDKTGERYGKGKGYKIFVDGEEVFSAENICKFER